MPDRALVALSEDGMWLCGLAPSGQFIVAKFSEGDFDDEWGYWPTGWGTCDKAAVIEDTGQDAPRCPAGVSSEAVGGQS